jgi:hypothetical protein
MKKNHIELSNDIRMTNPIAKIQSNIVINQSGCLKCFSNSCKSFIIEVCLLFDYLSYHIPLEYPQSSFY